LAGSPLSGRPRTEIVAGPGTQLRRIEKLRITISSSPHDQEQGRTLDFAQDEVRIGKSEELDVTLGDGAVSHEHLSLRADKHGWMLVDLGSTNGTFAGDMRIDRVTVREPLQVTVGKTVLRVEPLGEHIEQEISSQRSFGRMLGHSDQMREMFAVLEKVAASELTVLVEGETGTGKELAAEGLHSASGRAGELVTVNCGAIPRELIESELMGHVKGAFTGAVSDRAGAFAAADRGTLFLDEIGELPIDMQAKLLRALEHGVVKPVGSDRNLPVDVRVVAATNRNLAQEAERGDFRQDLYYRLAVVVVRIPPLRTRLEDLPLLVDHIQGELNRRRAAAEQPPRPPLDDNALALLKHYDFPGNVRELRNIVERWSVLGTYAAPGNPTMQGQASDDATDLGGGNVDGTLLELAYHEAKDAWVERFERSYVTRALERASGNVSQAARDAKVDRRHLQRLMARYGIRKPS
jgi:transcriptional regulator with GAF, ATPase, and Fis domain